MAGCRGLAGHRRARGSHCAGPESEAWTIKVSHTHAPPGPHAPQSPRPVRGSKSGLLKCFVRREPAAHGAGGPRRFSLWLGRDPTSPGANPARTRFLLAALQSSRSDTAFFTSGRADAPPCAQLGTNVFATRYILTAGPSPQGEGLLAELQYRARVKGFMQPRRLQVTLPQPPPPQAGLPVAAGPSPRVSPQASSRSWVSADSVASLGGADAPRWGTTGPGERPLGPARKTGPSAREEQQQPSGSGRVSRFLFRLAALPSRAPRHRPPDLLPEVGGRVVGVPGSWGPSCTAVRFGVGRVFKFMLAGLDERGPARAVL